MTRELTVKKINEVCLKILELRHCLQINPVVDSCIFDVGWALPAIGRWYQRVLVGTAHPTIKNYCNARVKYIRNYNQTKGKLKVLKTYEMFRTWSNGVLEYWGINRKQPTFRHYTSTPKIINIWRPLRITFLWNIDPKNYRVPRFSSWRRYFGSEQWKRQGRAHAAGLAVFQLDGAVVQLSHLCHEIESQTGTFIPGVGSL